MVNHVVIPQDRSLLVESGQVVYTDYVPVHKIRLGCRERMALGDVEVAYRRQLAIAPSQAWPCPVGEWDAESDYFVIYDGRHSFIASLMLGFTHILVAWVEPLDIGDHNEV